MDFKSVWKPLRFSGRRLTSALAVFSLAFLLSACGQGEGGPGYESHNSGADCLAAGCHSGGGEHSMAYAGTVYDTSSGNNVVAGAMVKITPPAGAVITRYTDGLGNFWVSGNVAFNAAGTYSVEVIGPGGVSYPMPTTHPNNQTQSSCNMAGCHAAPPGQGRVFAP